MNELKACGIVLCALIICIVFKNIKSEYSLFIRILITVGIFGASLNIFYPVLTYIIEISKGTSIYTYMPILFKALGIAFTVQITSDICKDSGEEAIAEKISLFGKAEILVISLPIIKNLFNLTETLLK